MISSEQKINECKDSNLHILDDEGGRQATQKDVFSLKKVEKEGIDREIKGSHNSGPTYILDEEEERRVIRERNQEEDILLEKVGKALNPNAREIDSVDAQDKNIIVRPGAQHIGGLDEEIGDVYDNLREGSFNDGTALKQNTLLVEAQLVEDNPMSSDERNRIVKETREQVYTEMGQVMHAEIVEEKKTTWSKRWVVILVLLFVVVLGTVLGVILSNTNSDNSSVHEDITSDKESFPPTPTPASIPSSIPITIQPSSSIPSNILTSSLEPIPDTYVDLVVGEIRVGEEVLWEYDGTVENDSYYGYSPCQFGCFAAALDGLSSNDHMACSHAGIFYFIRGTGSPVWVSRTAGTGYSECGSDMEVYTATNGYYTCMDGITYPDSSELPFAMWIAEAGKDYLVHLIGVDSLVGLEMGDNNEFRYAYGPLTPFGVMNLPGKFTDNGISLDADMSIDINCGSAVVNKSPGVWYKIFGNGKAISVTCSSCGIAFGFEVEISVFEEIAPTEMNCVDLIDNAFVSEGNIPYYILVQPVGGVTGNFNLQLATEGTSLVTGDVCSTAQYLQIGDTVPLPLSEVTEIDSGVRSNCYPSLSIGYEPVGVWFKVIGNGASMTASVKPRYLEGDKHIWIDILEGSSCSTLSCVHGRLDQDPCVNTNSDYCLESGIREWMSILGKEYYVFVSYNKVDFPLPPSQQISLTVT